MSLTKLELWRMRRAMSIQDLADKSGVNRATINRIETNRVNPSGRTLGKLAQALSVDPTELLEGEQAQPRQPSPPIAVRLEGIEAALRAFATVEDDESQEEVELEFATLIANHKGRAIA